jgi:hypothetical protein
LAVRVESGRTGYYGPEMDKEGVDELNPGGKCPDSQGWTDIRVILPTEPM